MAQSGSSRDAEIGFTLKHQFDHEIQASASDEEMEPEENEGRTSVRRAFA